MKSKDPFDHRATNGIEDLYRREREQALMLKRALAPTSALLKQFEELQNSGVLEAAYQARKMHADQFKSINWTCNGFVPVTYFIMPL